MAHVYFVHRQRSNGAALDVSLSDDRLVRITESGGEQLEGDVIARLHRSKETYEIEAREAHPEFSNSVRYRTVKMGSCRPRNTPMPDVPLFFHPNNHFDVSKRAPSAEAADKRVFRGSINLAL